jgi:hypothetical protein
MEIDGGIIIWSTFWESVSKLLTGSTVDSIIGSSGSQGASSEAPSARGRSDSDVARELQAQFDGNAANAMNQETKATATDSFSRQRSDSDVARELQAQWDAEAMDQVPDNVYGQQESTTATNTVPVLASETEVKSARDGIRRHDRFVSRFHEVIRYIYVRRTSNDAPHIGL